MRLLTTVLTGASSILFMVNLPATTLIFDDFGPATPPSNANLNGWTPNIGPADWVAYSGGIDVGWKVYDGEALMGTSASSQNGMGGITLGANYFANNPDIYSLEANYTMTASSSADWYAIGFAQTFPTSGSRGFYESGTNEGEPWLFIRQNGEVNVRSDGGTSLYTQSGFDVSDIDVELQLDTTQANWTVGAFVNGAQIDLNGGSPGMLFTYGTNPTDIAGVGVGATGGVDGQLQTFSLNTIPEPGAYALILGLAILGLRSRRR